MFGDKLFNNQGYPTPLDSPVDFTTLTIRVPNSAAWWAIYLGVLETLTDEDAWQQLDGGLSAEDAAAVALSVFIDAVDCAYGIGACMDCCTIAAQNLAATRATTLRVSGGVPQMSLDGGTTWLNIPDQGVGRIVPALTPTDGADDAEKICNAAWRATLVLAEFYKQTFGVISAAGMGTLRAIFTVLNDIGNMLLDMVVEAYTGVQAGQTFYADYPYTGHISVATLTDQNKTDLLCLLEEHGSVTAGGLVTFNFANVQSNMVSAVGVNPGFLLNLLLTWIGVSGLNRAGNVGSAIGDCTVCDTWCYTYDFTASDGGWTTYSFGGGWQQGTYVAGQGWKMRQFQGGGSERSLVIHKAIPGNYDQIVMVLNGDPGSAVYRGDGFPGAPTYNFTGTTTRTLDTDVTPASSVYIDLYNTGGAGGEKILQSITFRGHGTNPFGSSNC